MVTGARKKTSKTPFYLLLTFLLVGGAFWLFTGNDSQSVEEVLADELPDRAQTISADKIIKEYDYEYIVQEEDVLSDVFAEKEVPFSEIVALEQVDSDVFSFKKIRVGKSVYVNLFDEESDIRLSDIYYQPDLYRVIHAQQTSGGWVIEEEKIIYENKIAKAKGRVESSLYVSALDAGLDEGIILEMADVFAWDIDFALQTRSGDEYKVIYEQRYLEGELITTGRVLAAEYVNNGYVYQAFYFKDESMELGAYFTDEGNALQKAFLKAPVNYRYVSSGFSSGRFHPVIGKVIPHNGVDYAAATGTPIIAVADGVVSRQGWQTAYGNRIELKHGDRYGTQYSHMSAYVNGLSVGDQVVQGQVVGYVGSTGYSTGPHVHYSVTDRGTYANPDTIDVPDGEPVPEKLMEAYLELVQQQQTELEQL
jgi:murein DD-endopeptidase MepM/ murein hydrolase activator NlpD